MDSVPFPDPTNAGTSGRHSNIALSNARALVWNPDSLCGYESLRSRQLGARTGRPPPGGRAGGIESRNSRRTANANGSRAGRDIGRSRVEAACSKPERMDTRGRQEWMRAEFAARLGDIEPHANPRATLHWSQKLPDANLEGITIEVEPNITVPLLLFRPRRKARSQWLSALRRAARICSSQLGVTRSRL